MMELQNFIYEGNQSRLNLINYVVKSTSVYKISVYRNHSFELVEHTIGAYLDYADIKAEFLYSDYDDSLSFIDLDLDSDMLILWLDLSRYKIDDVSSFIKERVLYLTQVYNKPILFVPFLGQLEINNSRVVTYNVSKVKSSLGDLFLDERLEPFSGTKLSAKSLMAITKDIGLNYIPVLLKPALKAIIFDLDNTLHKGVLGEDGFDGVVLTDFHKKLQEKIVDLSKQGFFICLVSKNDEDDVLNLFKHRKDYPLKLEHFTKISASWDLKAESIKNIAKFLNIGLDSILFVDDNLGELSSVSESLNDIKLLWAKEDASITLKILENYPGLLKLNVNNEDILRKNDTIANVERKKVQSKMSKEDYIKSLNMELTFSVNNKNQIERISELANKTNQFIFSYKRYSTLDVENLMNNPDNMVISVSLSDRLSDSGIVGVLVFKNVGEYVELEECFVSCRALGRGIDENMVLYPFKLALENFSTENLKVSFVKGERNIPAEMFVQSHLINYVDKPNSFNVKVLNELIKVKVERFV